MSVILTTNHPKDLWPGVNAHWGAKDKAHKIEYTDLFSMESSTQNYEEDVLNSGFPLAPRKNESTSVTYSETTQGYTTRYVNVAYGLGAIISREAIDDGKYEPIAKRLAGELAFSMNQTKEYVGANIYNRAFTAGYTFGDGKIMCTTDHPTLAGDFSNTLSVAANLSETAIEDMITQIMGTTNERGHITGMMPDCLIIPRQLWFEANRILKSTLQNDSANNALNVLNSLNSLPGGIKMNHYLTDSNAWFIRTNAERGMIGFNRISNSLTKDNDFDTDNAKMKCYERYSFGLTNPRGVFASEGV